MKIRVISFAALAVLLLGARIARAEVSVGFFYDALAPYGDWVEVEDYGYSWQPRDVDDAWRPYTVGEWAYTDAGWTWISDEPFGWAVYHYGRWLRLGRVGWVWVPDVEWAPAWVSWRTSERYVGWAPLPPESRRIEDVELGPWVDSYFDVGPAAYTFVETRRFGSPRLASVIVPPRENLTIIRETRNVTNVRVVNHIVINNGPDYGTLARASERPVRKLRLEREEAAPSALAAANLRARVVGDSVRVAVPTAKASASGDAKPPRIARRVESAEIDRGWKSAGSPDQVAPLREKMKAEAKVPAGLPQPTARGTARSGEAPSPAATPKVDAAATAERGSDKETPKKAPAPKATAKGGKRGAPTPEPAPIGEAPRRMNTPAPSTERSTTQVPTPEPLRYREPRPDGADRTKHPPSVTRPPAAEPKPDAPRSEPRRERPGREPDRVQPPRPEDREGRATAREDGDAKEKAPRSNAPPPGISRRGVDSPPQADRPAARGVPSAISSKPDAPGDERKHRPGGKEKKEER